MRHPTQLPLAAIPLAILLIGSLARWLPQSPPLLFATAAAGVLFVIEIFAPSMRRYIAWLVPAAILFAILLIGSLAGLPPRTALLVTIAAAVVFLVPAVRASIPSRFPAIAGNRGSRAGPGRGADRRDGQAGLAWIPTTD